MGAGSGPVLYRGRGAFNSLSKRTELFQEQDEKYKKKLLPKGTVRIAIEAGVKLGWEQWLYENCGNKIRTSFIGMKSFGASAPAKDVFEHFQINVDEICRQAQILI